MRRQLSGCIPVRRLCGDERDLLWRGRIPGSILGAIRWHLSEKETGGIRRICLEELDDWYIED